jgi:uncharacterized protein (DUF58 family)
MGRDRPPTEEELRRVARPSYGRLWIAAVTTLIVLGLVLDAKLLYLGALLVTSIALLPEIWYYIALRDVYVTRLFSAQRVRLGDELAIIYRIENAKLLPVPWVELEDNVPEQLAVKRARIFPSYQPQHDLLLMALSLWPRERVTRRYRMRAVQRGVWVCGPAYVRSSDPYGFLDSERKVGNAEGQNSVMVLPLAVPVERFGLPSRHPFGDFATKRRLLEDPAQVIGARDYQPGDSLRRVHWKATARAATLQSKVFPPTTSYALVIFFDIHTTDLAIAGVKMALFELGVCAAASIATWAAERRLATALFSNGLPSASGSDIVRSASEAHAFMRVPLSNHPRQTARIQETLARLQPYFGSSMARLLAREEPRLPPGSTIVYITAADALEDRVIHQLERLQRSGHSISVLLTGRQRAVSARLKTYFLGDEEVWHELARNALGDDYLPLGDERDGDDERRPADGSAGAADPAQLQHSFTLG